MSTALTGKGQITIPEQVRKTLGLVPGSKVDFRVDEQGRIYICKAEADEPTGPVEKDRFERIRGRATVKWKTDQLMTLLRGDD